MLTWEQVDDWHLRAKEDPRYTIAKVYLGWPQRVGALYTAMFKVDQYSVEVLTAPNNDSLEQAKFVAAEHYSKRREAA